MIRIIMRVAHGNRFSRRNWLLAACCLACCAPLAMGCLVIEKKQLVLVLPPDSNEMHLFYTFEGMSVSDKDFQDRGATDKRVIEEALGQLQQLKKNDVSFFLFAPKFTDERMPALRLLRFEPLFVYRDETRERKLCAYRRAVLEDRRGLELYLNQFVTTSLYGYDKELTGKKLREEIAQLLSYYEGEEGERNRELYEALGVGPLMETGIGLFRLIHNLDDESLDKLAEEVKRSDRVLRPLNDRLWGESANEADDLPQYLAKVADDIDQAGGAFRWIRLEDEKIRIVLPATAKGAKDVAAHGDTIAWLKEMRKLVSPIEVVAVDEGVAIVLGKPGEPIRFIYESTMKYNPKLEAEFLRRAPQPQEVLVNGKPATAAALIEQFLEQIKKR